LRHIRLPVMPDEREPTVDVDDALRQELATQLAAVARALPDRINADPERVEEGLARLVLTLIEVVRKVLEHQAVRRMDGGGLSPEEVERLGLALLKLDERMQDMKGAFGLTDEDLQIDLGPLGRLR
jgi:gas vesicle protein GvpK